MKYNWNTFSKVLRILGYDQVSTTTQGYLYFNHVIYDKIILEKKNKYDEKTYMKYLALMKLPLPYFEKIYGKCKE